MDEARAAALDLALRHLPRDADADAVVAAAEKFHAFLVGSLDPITARPVTTPPPLPRDYDLAKADQTPPFGLVGAGVERDSDNIPTRLVRTPHAGA